MRLAPLESVGKRRFVVSKAIRKRCMGVRELSRKLEVELAKVRVWLSEVVVDLVLEWKRKKETAGMNVVEEV